jgi:hypothetical protein
MPELDRPALLAALHQISSEDDGEVLAGARAALHCVTDAGLKWENVILVPGVESAQPPAAAPLPLDDGDDSALIAGLLARSDLSEETRTELVDFQTELAAGPLSDMDRRYIRALAARLAAETNDPAV